MSGYRRFIAYVYEYQKGKKGSNCGFIKVEVRNQRCLIELHLHCAGIPPKTECRTYGFVRKDGLMNGILLGSCQTDTDSVECLIETDSMNMADSGFPLGKMGGIILITQSGGFFGTEWDDQPVRPDNFREIRTSRYPETEPEPAPDHPPEEIHEEVPDLPPEEMTAPANMPAPNDSELPLKEPSPDESTSVEPISVESIQEESTPEESIQDEPVPVEPAPEESIQDEPVPEEPTPEESIQDEPVPLEPAPIDSTADTVEATSASAAAPARQFFSPGEEFMPFDDVEFIKCWKIHPNDLARCSPRVRSLRNNRFLQYGYYNFGHLLLGKRSNGRFVLGIPGGYDQQERFMANMFGFPYFKECRLIELPRNRGGYWYRLIDAPNFH